MAATTSAALEGLPKQFVSAMKTLFEIMDDKKTGFVRLTDLENFWSDEGLDGMPRGVLESLRKVTPTNGLLSFERFCAGLKICLLRYQSDQQKMDGTKVPLRSPSAPILDSDSTSSPAAAPPPPIHPRSPTATVRPNNALLLHSRAISMPQLMDQQVVGMTENDTTAPPPIPVPMMGPPKPPRVVQAAAQQNNVITNGALMMRTRSEISTRQTSAIAINKPLTTTPENSGGKSQLPMASLTERAIAKAEVRTALQQWQLAQINNEKQGGSNKDHSQQNAAAKRREPRRHTLQSGVDQSMLKRMHVLEQERVVLTTGLQAVERAQEWFRSQLSSVQEKIRSLGKTTVNANDSSIDAQQERLGFKIARIEEVSRQLIMLIDNADRGFPVHMNLALADRNKITKLGSDGDSGEDEANRILRRLKTQNHLLTEEVGRKSERIAVLEKEKGSLIRELFQARSSQQPASANRIASNTHPSDDNTLM
nr:EOG090X08VB [Ilyocryptus agilis]